MKRLLIALSIVASLAATPHPLGWKSNPHHSRDLKQIQSHPLFKAAPLPPAASVESGQSKVYDQFYLGSCVANAGSAALDYQWKQRTGFWIGPTQTGPSRLDLYQNCLRHDGNFPHDYGTYTSSCLWVLKNKGVLTELSWPYNPANLSAHAPTNFSVDRKHFAAVSTYDVSNTDHGYSFKQCIANAHLPVMIGGWVKNGIFRVTADNPFIPDEPNGKIAGGHEMLGVAYDDNLVHDGIKGWVLLRNSWSETWGKKGYGWMSQQQLFNPKRFEDFGAVELTGPRVVKHRTSAVRGSSETSSPQRKTIRWPWQKAVK
jgi:C1A family cysteine protease